MTATVVVLTFNARPWIAELLDALSAQRTSFPWNTLVIDSGSTDGTVAILRRQAASQRHQLRLVEIPNEEFGHGKTRNLAAHMADGQIIVFLTQDAIPEHPGWLEAMVQPFSLSDRVACVYGKQEPRADCCPAVKRDVLSVFRSFGPNNAITLQERTDQVREPAQQDSLTFFSDVNSAVRKSILVGAIPYRDLDYAEDQAFGSDVISAGYLKVYSPFGSVVHSHSYPPARYFRRMYDEMVGLRRATGRTLDTSILLHLIWVGRATWADWRFVAADAAYSPRLKAKWIAQAPIYNVARRAAIRLAARNHVPPWLRDRMSLQRSLRDRVGADSTLDSR